MAENATNKRVMKALRGYHPVRVENPACPGTPDINCTLGWIEDKMLPRWPGKGHIVRCDHFTPQQRVWHRQRAAAGGKSWVFVQVGRDYLLLPGHGAAIYLGNVGEDELNQLALGRWNGKLVDEELVALLKR